MYSRDTGRGNGREGGGQPSRKYWRTSVAAPAAAAAAAEEPVRATSAARSCSGEAARHAPAPAPAASEDSRGPAARADTMYWPGATTSGGWTRRVRLVRCEGRGVSD